MTPPDASVRDAVNQRVDQQREAILRFFREIVAIPSLNSQIRAVGERVETEMRTLGCDEIFWDKMGNIVGRIGDGDTILLYDTHLDTVGIGDPTEWDWDPFQGKVEDGVFYGRGACDEKQSTPGMLYGLAIARDLGLLDGFTFYVFGNVEEWNEGSAPNALVQTEGIRPHYVVIGEPTAMTVARGQKGRAEYRISATGRSAHAANNHLGDNALYKLLPVLDKIRQLETQLADDAFLGDGRITITDLQVETASSNAVPNRATAIIDRRLTVGEDAYDELARLRALVGQRDDITVSIPVYDEPSYTGFVFPLEMVYPAWVTSPDDPLVRAGLAAGEALFGATTDSKWNFSTNGVYWAGKKGIPTIGFGPGDERHAHTVLDQVLLDDVVRATAWYALLPAFLRPETSR